MISLDKKHRNVYESLYKGKPLRVSTNLLIFFSAVNFIFQGLCSRVLINFLEYIGGNNGAFNKSPENCEIGSSH